MKLKKALQKAKAYARRYRTDRHVIVEAGEYDHCSDFDLSTWYLGARVIATFDPSGDGHYE